MKDKLEDNDGLKILSDLEESSNIEFDDSDKTVVKKKSLGKPSKLHTTAAGESPWKLVSLDTLPSKGMMYPPGFEMLIKSAKTKEIRHWSTIDEHDPLDVFEKITFIVSSCSKINVKNANVKLNINDILEIDKYHLLFKIHKITFPNNENKLIAKVKDTNPSCNTTTSVHVTDSNLQGFVYPRELMEWYSKEEQCFIVESEKLNETIRIYMPTLGSTKIFNEYIELCRSRGLSQDDAFDRIAPYLIGNWRTTSPEDLINIRNKSNSWNENKFLFLHGFTNQLIKNSRNRVLSICESCKSKIDSSIFLGGSFTVKDIFIVSSRLRDLI